MEDLALGINIGVEAGLVLGGTVELGLGDLGVGWVDSLTGSQQGLHFSGGQSRLQQVEDILTGELVGLGVSLELGSGEADEGEEDQGLHDGCGDGGVTREGREVREND